MARDRFGARSGRALAAANVDVAVLNVRVSVRGFGECWPCRTTPGSSYGYCRVRINGRASWTPAHRAAYAWFHGDVPEGMVIMHTCDNPPCCNPAHLKLGTHQENMADAAAKGLLGKYRHRRIRSVA